MLAPEAGLRGLVEPKRASETVTRKLCTLVAGNAHW